jgi:copper chaperone NosL
MQRLSTWLMLGASGILLLLFAFPLWRISLEAPQFPGGLYLDIWINKLSGSSKHILQNINILNHYIGMKPVEPDSIPELKYFPYIVVGMSVLGVMTALIGRKYVYLGWFLTLLLLGTLGVYDFYSWLYDYGRNLDPNAPIEVPGMVYQPPLFGRKDLLNFVAHSYPAMGAVFLAISAVLSFLAFYFKK